MKQQCSVVHKEFKKSSYCGACYHALDISFDSETWKQMAHMKGGKKGGHPLLGCLKYNETVIANSMVIIGSDSINLSVLKITDMLVWRQSFDCTCHLVTVLGQ